MRSFYTNSSQKGFTLIEMIVSLAIFTVVAVVAIGALLRVMDANKKSINLKTTINNLNFVLESMSREMRVGSKYSLSTSNGDVNQNYYDGQDGTVTSGDWTLAFTSSNKNVDGTCNLIYAYRYDSSTKTLQKARQYDCSDTLNNGNSAFDNVTSADMKITSAMVWLSGNVSGQPYATLLIRGESGVKIKDKVDFSVQTRVSQRIK